MKNKPLARSSNLVIQESNTELLIYDLKTDKAYCLNETSSLVWQLCNGKHTVAEISDKLSKQMKMLVGEDFVWIAIDQFRKDELLEYEIEMDERFSGLSRREIIRKVGFTSMVALPIISSVVAPKAAMAQSGPMNLSVGDSCGTDPQCTSGNCSPSGTCCVSTSLHNRTPGSSYGSSFNVQNCSTQASLLCCSGSGFWLGTSTTFPSGTVIYQCQCN